ncbi:hypothetical protein [Haemophilus haemolyticus]|uniref:Putative adenylyl cyclase class-3/4/guanylyl cyclase n=1 Tax=Haemophilus haemolyticus M19501 TaxID=1028803 RepID=F9GRM8_HAEHA|nr:hypothetical protein [Haemophilus haemolyticus]EGT73951.1 putative adenylyl cyclase class-3/4/guanylyl cyclase [Haemophilus haemolyticus M19501]
MSILTENQKKEFQDIINKALNIADKFWKESGGELEKEAILSAHVMDGINESVNYSEESISTRIPNFDLISSNQSVNSELIAIVADMRDSTKHAKTRTNIMNPLRRIFLETSALLPAMEKAISIKGGSVTEYLGDGVLGFFEFNEDNIYNSYNAARIIINEVRPMLNVTLNKRYCLPENEINIGVGLAKSKAIIYVAGIESKHPKAFGSCVYDATKLSSERNIIGVSNELEAVWPRTKNGTLQFEKCNFANGNIKGYKINPRNR